MVPTPLSGGEAAYNGRELVDHLADGTEVGLSDGKVKRGCLKYRPHHFGDDNHCCHGRHGCF